MKTWDESKEKWVEKPQRAGRTDIPQYPPHPFAFNTRDDDPRNDISLEN